MCLPCASVDCHLTFRSQEPHLWFSSKQCQSNALAIIIVIDDDNTKLWNGNVRLFCCPHWNKAKCPPLCWSFFVTPSAVVTVSSELATVLISLPLKSHHQCKMDFVFMVLHVKTHSRELALAFVYQTQEFKAATTTQSLKLTTMKTVHGRLGEPWAKGCLLCSLEQVMQSLCVPSSSLHLIFTNRPWRHGMQFHISVCIFTLKLNSIDTCL